MSGSTVPSALQGVSFVKQVLATRLVAVQVDDTLPLIALRELGDANQWTLIAQLNNLSDPYIVNDLDDFVDGTVVAGTKIMVPAPTTQVSNGVTDIDTLLGTDLALPQGLLLSDGAGDILTVTGADNLKQAISHRLNTMLQELIRHPKYGDQLFTLLGQGNTPQALQLAEAWATSCIMSDPRVSEVQKLDVTLTLDVIRVTAIAIPISGAPVTVGGSVTNSTGSASTAAAA